ncbi:hypothetical protein [Haloarchaeobius sp. TZWWS8]|uniref:hypothetical protein n=1 Tax=Haloarchaeobius sp. TZWWS8 TaxID=3446121 RepID=UPI003EBE3216
MTVSNRSELVEFDADAVAAFLRENLSSGLRAVVEYHGPDWNPLFITEEAIQRYGNEEAAFEVAEEIHRSLRLDLREDELYTDLLVDAGRFSGFVLLFENLTIIRYTRGDEGMYIALDPNISARPVLDAVTPLL